MLIECVINWNITPNIGTSYVLCDDHLTVLSETHIVYLSLYVVQKDKTVNIHIGS